MKLIKSIVILSRKAHDKHVIDLVLLVKHPEGCDPIECIHAAIGDFARIKQAENPLTHRSEFTLSDIFRDMKGWDWSTQGLFIEEAPVWAVIDGDEYKGCA